MFAVMTSKGRVTIPQDIRKKLGLSQGARVDFVNFGNSQFGIMAVVDEVTSLKGLVRKPVSHVTLTTMKQSIAERDTKG